ncbi:MAG: inositol-3-phosphate synthase, partial [Acidobacteria bacterium]|nr:inositol-3-phosphate synthase [Acidobacteriota bacterium]
MVEKGVEIAPASGKLGILLVGLGAVSTTFVAGVEAIRKGMANPIGSLTQMGTIRLGKRTDNNCPKIKDFVPLADLDDVVFGAWDIFSDSAYEAARNAGVLEKAQVEDLREQLESLKPMAAVFEQNYVKRITGENVKIGKNKMELAEQLIADIARFKEEKGCERLVIVFAASTEIFLEQSAVHQTLEAFEKGLYDDDPLIAPSMIYAYAALKSKVPFANGAPNLSCDIPALTKLSEDAGVPICGKDFKTGQTLMKTIIAPGLKARMLGL